MTYVEHKLCNCSKVERWNVNVSDLLLDRVSCFCATPEPCVRNQVMLVGIRVEVKPKSGCHEGSQKRKEKTMPFGVNLMRSQVLYRAAQVEGSHACSK